MDTCISDLPEDIDVPTAILHQHQQYWCVVNKRDGKWYGYVGSSGKGNQRTKYTAFTIFRPVHEDIIVSVLFEYLTNPKLFDLISRRSYKFTLTTLKQLLDHFYPLGKIWSVRYRNRPAYLSSGQGRKLSLKVAGNHELTLNIDDWKPNLIQSRTFI